MAKTLAVSSPLSTGDIVGRSFRIFRQHILLIGKILLLPTIILCLGRIAVVVGSTYGAKFLNNPVSGAGYFGLAGVGGIIALVGVTLLWIRQLALVRLLTGFDSTYEAAREHVKGKVYSVIVLYIVFVVALIGVGIVFGLIFGFSAPFLKGSGALPWVGSLGLAISLLGAIVSLMFIGLVFQLAASSIALQKNDISSVISESFFLTVHSFWRSIGFLTMTIIAVTSAAYPFQLPVLLLMGIFMVMHGAATGNPETTLPLGIQIFNSVWEAGVNMFIGPIYYLCYALYYSDLRMRKEGVDLIERIESLREMEQVGRSSSHGI